MSSLLRALQDTAEARRITAADSGQQDWRAWGPYLSERAWGTVREDYSEDGSAWDYFPHDHARSRAYRWNEDGLVGLCDANQVFCFALGLWNGTDPIVKERIFGLTGPVHAWAALRVFEIDGSRDHEFLARVFGKLLLNFTWWVHRKDSAGNNVFDGAEGRLLAIVDAERLARILAVMLDEQEFLSPYGLRALSRRHDGQPFMLHLAGASYAVDYEPGESTTGLFGGNSNWRGPIWFPVNYLIIDALHRYARFFGDDILIEHPAGSGNKVNLTAVADDLAHRLISIFLDDTCGRRPVFGGTGLFQTHPDWHDLLPFHEYFHGDTGRGAGASHQTGWTALVADLVMRAADRGATSNQP